MLRFADARRRAPTARSTRAAPAATASGTVNVSTMAALVAAGAGARVVKHGNRAASSQCGSADVLEALGVVDRPRPRRASRAASRRPASASASRRATTRRCGSSARRASELGVPTTFNFLGPLANPAGVRRQAVGVSRPGDGRADARHAARARRRARAWCSSATTASTSSPPPTHAHRATSCATARCTQYDVDPLDFGIARAERRATSCGGDAATNAGDRARGARRRAGPVRDIVVLERRGRAGGRRPAPTTSRPGSSSPARRSTTARAAATLERFVDDQPGANARGGSRGSDVVERYRRPASSTGVVGFGVRRAPPRRLRRVPPTSARRARPPPRPRVRRRGTVRAARRPRPSARPTASPARRCRACGREPGRRRVEPTAPRRRPPTPPVDAGSSAAWLRLVAVDRRGPARARPRGHPGSRSSAISTSQKLARRRDRRGHSDRYLPARGDRAARGRWSPRCSCSCIVEGGGWLAATRRRAGARRDAERVGLRSEPSADRVRRGAAGSRRTAGAPAARREQCRRRGARAAGRRDGAESQRATTSSSSISSLAGGAYAVAGGAA